jgi:ferrous iron transport protein B
LASQVSREASELAARHVRLGGTSRVGWQRRLDLLLTGKWTGIPAMALLFALVLWITIEGANVPSAMLASLLVDTLHPWLKTLANNIGLWPWLSGLLIDGMYLSGAWVVSVMLPPMTIFFPLFTLLEDFGYLPRVAFNLDRIFQKAGAHGKQALTMTMGLGCNAAGVVATRIIESPRERLIAIITNNFSLCNGRWPTQILMATVFVGALAPPSLAGIVAASSVFFVAVLGFVFALGSSWLLSRTLLKGQASSFSLELPPYRPPDILRTLYTSLIDRTLFVLWRAVVFAVPAGAVIWLIANVGAGGHSVAWWMATGLDPLAWVMGLTGIILVAYIVAIPANEIVVPSILMLTVLLTGNSVAGAAGAGVMFETEDHILHGLLTGAGWTTLTAVCLMLFSLLHNPCSTTLYTIYKETGSWRWTALSAALPLLLGFSVCSLVALVWRTLAVW